MSQKFFCDICDDEIKFMNGLRICYGFWEDSEVGKKSGELCRPCFRKVREFIGDEIKKARKKK